VVKQGCLCGGAWLKWECVDVEDTTFMEEEGVWMQVVNRRL